MIAIGVVLLALIVGGGVYWIRSAKKKRRYHNIPDFSRGEDWSLKCIHLAFKFLAPSRVLFVVQ